MEIPFYQIDAFTSRVFAGNPAGVCFLEAWPEEGLLQSIAAENNLAETAFLVGRADGSYDLRWFTPKMEVDLCGHATLASAFAIFEFVAPSTSATVFHTKSGMLSVERQGDLLVMDFPARPPKAVEPPSNLAEMLGLEPLQVLGPLRCLGKRGRGEGRGARSCVHRDPRLPGSHHHGRGQKL